MVTKEEEKAIQSDNHYFIDADSSKFEQDALVVLIVSLAAACVLVGLFIVEVFSL